MADIMQAELKPCPFCGSGDVSPGRCEDLAGKVTGRFVECEDCAAFGPVRKAAAEAVAAWNGRA